VSVLDLSRWQFGITTVYHFLFVPVTIGLAFLVAGFETAWLRTGNERWLRLTKFYGKLLLINCSSFRGCGRPPAGCPRSWPGPIPWPSQRSQRRPRARRMASRYAACPPAGTRAAQTCCGQSTFRYRQASASP